MDLITPKELPDERPDDQPLPWRLIAAGNGHTYIYDANKVMIAHVYCWDENEDKLFKEALERLTGNNYSWQSGLEALEPLT